MLRERHCFQNNLQERDLDEGIHVWEDYIRIDLKETGILRGIGLIRLRIGIFRVVVNAALKLLVL